MRALVVLLILLAPTASAAQERPVPSDSSRITIPGCARDRAFIVGSPEGHEISATGIRPGRRFRLAGPRAVLDDIRKREATMLEITVKISDL